MKIGVRLNLQTFRTVTITEDFSISFADISNLQEWDDSITVSAEVVDELEMYYHDGERYLGVDTTNPVQQPEDEFYDNDVSRPSLEGYIIFNCIISDSDLSTLLTLINLGIVELDQFGKTNIIAYRLNDKRNKLSKTLIPVTILEGTFKAPLGIKTLELDVTNYDINNSYNYVYIPKLKRYFYITNIQLTTKDYTKLLLQEDVLMSHADLIRSQSAFVTRYEGSTNNLLVDNRRPLRDTPDVSVIAGIPTTSGSKVNIELNFNITGNNLANFLIVARNKNLRSGYPDILEGVQSPVDNYLPDIRPHINSSIYCYFLPASTLRRVIYALNNDDTVSSYVDSIIWLPFDPKTAFNLPSVIPTSHPTESLSIGSKWFNNDTMEFQEGEYQIPDCAYILHNNNDKQIAHSPYLIVFDGYFNFTNDWRSYEPFSLYEINVPFVGLVKVQAKDIIGKRILIYYSMDLRNGSATAYIYDYDLKHIIWSGACQLGIMLPLTSSNSLENLKTRQSNDLNMFLGLLSSGLAVAGGVVSDNPVAIAGGVLSAGKTIASHVQTNRMIFDRGQVMFNGSGEGALYSSYSIFIKRTYNTPITINESVYKSLEGLPYNNYVLSLSTLTTGYYVEIGDIEFNANGNNIYQTEIDEIVALLKNGVIL